MSQAEDLNPGEICFGVAAVQSSELKGERLMLLEASSDLQSWCSGKMTSVGKFHKCLYERLTVMT